MFRKLLIVLGTIILLSVFFWVSCDDTQEIVVDTQGNIEKVSKEELDINKEKKVDINLYLNKNNELLLNNGDRINVYEKYDYVVVNYSRDNKLDYSFDYYFTDNNIHIDFYSHKLVSSISDNLDYFHKVNKQYIKNKKAKAKTLTFKFNQGNEINIVSKESHFTYKNLTDISFSKGGESHFLIVDLTNEDYCNEDNLILFNKNTFNQKLIEYHNKLDINNLKCGKENIILFNNNYNFYDERDFSLFTDEVIVNSKKKIFESLNNEDVYINTLIEDNYIYINLNNIDKFNYSLNYDYNENKKLLNIIVNKIPERWISVDKIKINKNVFYKIDKINLEERNYRDYEGKNSINNIDKDDFSLYSFKNKNGHFYTYINDLSCEYFSDQLLIEINDFEDKSDLVFINGKEKECNKYETKKVAINYDKLSLVEKEITKKLYNLGFNKYFEIEYDDDTYYFKYKNDYRVYNYKVINNQLYLYIDKENNEYDILNKEIKKIKIEQFSNINVINLYKDDTYKKVLKDNLKVYRDYPEKLQANIRKYNSNNNYLYYSLRFNSIQLDNDYIICNPEPFNIEKVREGTNAYSLIFKDDTEECNKYGVGIYVVKLIGSDIDVDFIEKRDNNKLEKLRNEHDRQQFNLKKAIKNLDIDFEFDVIYLNNKRKFILKVNNFNINSSFSHTLKIKQKGSNIILDIKETENLKQDDVQYFYFDTEEDFSNILINIDKLEGEKKYKISLN